MILVEDNIKLPFLYASPDKKGVGEIEDFDTVVSAIEIRHILKKKPLECSGGEKARAVFARGIIMKPQIILADAQQLCCHRSKQISIIGL